MPFKIEKRKAPILSVRATFEPSTVDEKNRTVELVFTTSTKVKRGFWDPFLEELSMDPKHVRMDRLNNGAPLLDSHNRWSLDDQLGVVEKAWMTGKEGRAVVRFPKEEDDERADKIFRKVKDGIIRNVSVGYAVHKYEEVGDSKSARKNGQLPTYRAIDWEPMEVSLVPVPADGKAGVRSDGEETEVRMFECEIIRSAEEIQAEPAGAGKAQPDGARASPEDAKGAKKMNEEEVKKAQEEAARKAQEAERTRSAEIMKSVTAAGLDVEFARKLIEENKSVEESRGMIIDEMAKRTKEAKDIKPAAPSIEAGADADDKFRKGASEWLMIRSGRDVQTTVEKHTGQKLDAGEFRGMSLVDIARESLERRGVKTRGWDRMKLVGEALTHRSGMNSTSDFAILLESAMHKTLLGAYAITPDTWSRFCRKSTVSDFRDHNRYRVGSFGTLDTVAEGEEYKNKQIPDGEKRSISAKTKGNIIALSRQAIINDDMQAFADLSMRWGRAAKLSVESDVYALLNANSGLGPTQADSNPFFHSARKNVGTGAALTMVSIDSDRAVMAAQTDPSGNEILDLRPAVLLVPVGYEGQAKSINEAQYDPDAVGKIAKPNIVRGLFRDVIGTARLTGKRYYMFADPNIAPAFEVAFLDGVEEPFLESKDGFRIDGVEWKVRLDYGTKEIDPRGAVTNKGESD